MWVKYPQQAPPGCKVKLVVFPYSAGRASMAATWPAALGPDVQVIAVEPPSVAMKHTHWRAYLDEVAPALAAEVGDTPYAVFGHSMGALLGWLLVVWMREHGKRPPVWFFPSAKTCPLLHQPNGDEEFRVLSDDQAVELFVRRHGSGLPEAIRRLPAMVRSIALAHRHDMLVNRSFWPAVSPPAYLEPLDVPFTVFVGSRDDVCPPETVLAWKQLCASPDHFRSVEVDGGHMFINPTQCGAVVLKEIAAVLKGL